MSSNFINKLTTEYPKLLLKEHKNFHWSPSEGVVYYDPSNDTQEGIWALLHESGHALLGHTTYRSDFELLKLEVEAWEKAKEVAPAFEISIQEDHVQDCLDSYRDWLHRRSLCPDCHLSSVQTKPNAYTCVFCHKQWVVTTERFCRPYRRST